MHILLVEDDPMIGEAVREALTDEGYDVLWAKSGWEAGGMLAAGTFDVVFLDLGLPGRDGMALLPGPADQGYGNAGFGDDRPRRA